MRKLISIGEALIDFIPIQKGDALKDVLQFKRVAGGAPANVCACVARLGGEALMLTKLGEDAFGNHIIDQLNQIGVNTSHVLRTNKAHTGLAFVSLKEDGQRDFSFYRNPSADMLLSEDEIHIEIFNQRDILHFCSVDLIDAPVKKAHDKAIEIAREKGLLISFDPNVRLPLWDDHQVYKKVINQYIDKADIIKISDEEVTFITGHHDFELGIHSLFRGYVKMVILTRGKDGATIYTKKHIVSHEGFKINAIDTTGAGDAFIGSFLFQLLNEDKLLDQLSKVKLLEYLEFSNAVGAIVSMKSGAIESMPSYDEVIHFMEMNKI
ncbi:MAG: carbohydrate kinase [Acholeplasmataceae bacterium]